ncbi:thiamine-phosphate kinase [Dictyobacter arantiisoli]|uniref:Thiamine-monophosphate kinase n=1 Tax=Dictyobacter arantiisoli TaxID=2014874 RepID=A0A5A5TIS8_9CHLR|nr:thiamine-phosphate kinase [Dictyobacter arantiisoli]GCF11510.1 thiamine-monophosphate kinase [Dictyobacter arantiisoli]
MDISELGEFALIARLTAGLTSHSSSDVGIGDDCAVLDMGGDNLLLATCDSQVEGVHFTLQTSSPEHIGRKALAINLSDIAAMGGEPRYALISLLLPPHLSVDVLDGIYAGLRAEATRFNTAIVGGNISGVGVAQQICIDITLLGTVKRGYALLRSGAGAGDILCVTGTPGESAAGLSTFVRPSTTPTVPPFPQLSIDPQSLQYVRERHTAPTARVREGQILSQLGPDKVTAALDISDGLSGDLQHLCERSQCGVLLDLARLPLGEPLHTIARAYSRDAHDWILHGGEDYELLFTCAPDAFEAVHTAIRAQTGTPVTPIGLMTPASQGMQILYPDGHAASLVAQSWDHLKH